MSSRTPSRRGASKAASPKKNNQRQLPAWLLLLTGFCLGFFVAFLIKLTPGPVAVPKLDTATGGDRQNSSKPVPVFDFYTVLPESEVILPEEPSTSVPEVKTSVPVNKKATSSSVKTQPKASKYLLQAGSFRSASDAERLRARLLLAGQEPRVVKVAVRTGEEWHRVQLGPFETKESIAQARKVLSDFKIDGLLLKVK